MSTITMERIMKDKKHSKCNTPGSLHILQEIIERESINVDVIELVGSLNTYIQKMTEKESSAFKGYFLRRMTISELFEMLPDFDSIEDAETSLKSAINKYLKLLKAEKYQ